MRHLAIPSVCTPLSAPSTSGTSGRSASCQNARCALLSPLPRSFKAPGLQLASSAQRRSAGRSILAPPRAAAATDSAVASGATSDSGALSSGEGLGSSSSSRPLRDYAEVAYLTGRTMVVTKHFDSALGIDDFLHRLEIALFAYGFNGDNAIAMVNLCRDEITVTLKQKIDHVFGSSFNTNGLGGVLTCGVTGVAAGLSHAPVSRGSGKERYVFFSFPHISIDAKGNMGQISRPGRPGMSCACGALNAALNDIKAAGLTANCKIPGVHDPLDPEYSILKQRLARRLRYEGTTDEHVNSLNLIEMTKVAERTITDDLEYLISQTVDVQKADYAVVTGVQVHSWGTKFEDDSPNLEYVAPTTVYVVVNGEKTHLDLGAMPSLTPRQIRLLAGKGDGPESARSRGLDDVVCNSGGHSTIREIDPPYLYNSKEMRRRQRERTESYSYLMEDEGLKRETACSWPSWQSGLRADEPHRNEEDNSAMRIDAEFSSDEELDEMWTVLQDKYRTSAADASQANEVNGTSAKYANGTRAGEKTSGRGDDQPDKPTGKLSGLLSRFVRRKPGDKADPNAGNGSESESEGS